MYLIRPGIKETVLTGWLFQGMSCCHYSRIVFVVKKIGISVNKIVVVRRLLIVNAWSLLHCYCIVAAGDPMVGWDGAIVGQAEQIQPLYHCIVIIGDCKSSSSYRRHSHCCIVISLLHCHFIVSSLLSSDPRVIVVVVAVIELSYRRRNQCLHRRFVLPCRVDCGVRCVGLVGGVETVDRGALVVVGVHSAYSIAIAAGSLLSSSSVSSSSALSFLACDRYV